MDCQRQSINVSRPEERTIPSAQASDCLEDRQADFEAALARAFSLEGYLAQLKELEARIREDIATGRLGELTQEASAAQDTIFARARDHALELFQPGVHARSDFFRDIAGAAYVEYASEVSRLGGPPFDMLVSLFDRSIIRVENDPALEDFSTRLLSAWKRIENEFEDSRDALADVLDGVAHAKIEPLLVVGTGYGRLRLPFPKEAIRSEILCHGLGAHLMFPQTATVLDIGGQDTKAIQVDAQGVVTSFQMNDRCAAGCGRYLGYIADEMGIGLQELGPLALGARRRVKINSTCTVFAGAEFRDRLSSGESREDILGGLHRAIILRAMALLARSGGIRNEFTFTGGVARNGAAVKALKELIEENYGSMVINIAPDSIYTGALGAAAFARRDVLATASQ